MLEKTYIRGYDFENPRDLALFLKNLMNNQTEYEEYFKWKQLYKTITFKEINSNKIKDNYYCSLCNYLHQNHNQKSHPLNSTQLSLIRLMKNPCIYWDEQEAKFLGENFKISMNKKNN